MEGLGHSGIRTLIVIPCLNEAKTIEGLLVKFTGAMQGRLFRIVVADGGSTDGTRNIVSAFAATDDRVTLLANPKRIQSAGINLAVATFGEDFDYLIRIDAHGDYPDDYCQRLIEDADRTGADSVVVAMDTVATACFRRRRPSPRIPSSAMAVPSTAKVPRVTGSITATTP